jgi:hydroxylamine reductase (hybrid-cluster protein)
LKALFKKAKNNAKQKKQKIYYINYFKGNMVVIYDLNKVLDIIKSKDIKGKLRFVSSKFKKRTASNLKDFGKKVDKDIIMLNPSIAKKIFYLDDDIKPVVC